MISFEDFEKQTELTNYYPYHMTLNLTNACNLACQYCFVNQENKTMPLDIAKKGIDFIWKNLQYHKYELKDIELTETSSIIFFGGEPLLTFHTVLKPLVLYMEKTYNLNEFVLQITTNGTLLNKEILDFFNQYHIGMLISFDGIQEIQDKNRPFKNQKLSSYNIIMNNLETLLFSKQYDIKYRLRATFDIKDINLWYKNFQFFNSLPIQRFVFMPEYYHNFTNEQKIQVNEQINLMCNDIYEIILNNSLPKYPVWDNYIDCLKQIILHDYEQIIYQTKINNYEIPRYLADACGYHLIGITMDYAGNFYTCREEPTMYSYDCHPTMIGNIHTGIDYDKLNQLKHQINKIEYNFLINRTCNQDCWYVKNNVKCNYAWCPAHTLKAQQIIINTCIFDAALCERISYDMFQFVNKWHNQKYIQYLRDNFPEYNFLYNYFHATPLLQQQMIKNIIEEQKNGK